MVNNKTAFYRAVVGTLVGTIVTFMSPLSWLWSNILFQNVHFDSNKCRFFNVSFPPNLV